MHHVRKGEAFGFPFYSKAYSILASEKSHWEPSWEQELQTGDTGGLP